MKVTSLSGDLDLARSETAAIQAEFDSYKVCIVIVVISNNSVISLSLWPPLIIKANMYGESGNV